MRANDRPCGHQVAAADDDEPFRLCREHIAERHQETHRADALGGLLVAACAT